MMVTLRSFGQEIVKSTSVGIDAKIQMNFRIKRRETAESEPDAEGDADEAEPPVADAGAGSEDG